MFENIPVIIDEGDEEGVCEHMSLPGSGPFRSIVLPSLADETEVRQSDEGEEEEEEEMEDMDSGRGGTLIGSMGNQGSDVDEGFLGLFVN